MLGYGLYYPYIHFRDEAWLKTAALYWPRMARIVPSGYPIADSDSVRALRDELDFVRDVNPAEAAETISAPLCAALIEHADRLQRLYSLQHVTDSILYELSDGHWKTRHEVNPFRSTPQPPQPGLRHGRNQYDLAGMFASHLAPQVAGLLQDMQLAVRLDRGPWFGMAPQFAWMYMCLLSDEIARTRGLVTMTDQTEAHAVTGGTPADVLGGGHQRTDRHELEDRMQQRLALMAVRTLVPANIAEIPMHDIIKLRLAHEADFDAFTSAMSAVTNEVAKDLAGVTDPAFLQDYLNDHVKTRFRQQTRDIQAAIRAAKHDAVFAIGTKKVEIPTLATLGASLAAGHPVVAAAGGLAVLLLTTRRTARKEIDAAMQPSAGSYLLRVEESLMPRSLLSQIRRGVTNLVGLAA